ncbi:MAG: hypothetical protein JSV50_17535 [Desulfobacteraceae bacterium]|nr:MAG: hypothetical protein JSV50_17535 [Desulfobacteraceae bacterium]
MDEKDIQKLFASVLEDPLQDTAAVRNVFSTLVSTTLKYRDDVLATRGVVVTVADVRTCLAWLVPVLATGTMPETTNKISLGLLRIWLDALVKKAQ